MSINTNFQVPTNSKTFAYEDLEIPAVPMIIIGLGTLIFTLLNAGLLAAFFETAKDTWLRNSDRSWSEIISVSGGEIAYIGFLFIFPTLNAIFIPITFLLYDSRAELLERIFFGLALVLLFVTLPLASLFFKNPIPFLVYFPVLAFQNYILRSPSALMHARRRKLPSRLSALMPKAIVNLLEMNHRQVGKDAWYQVASNFLRIQPVLFIENILFQEWVVGSRHHKALLLEAIKIDSECVLATINDQYPELIEKEPWIKEEVVKHPKRDNYEPPVFLTNEDRSTTDLLEEALGRALKSKYNRKSTYLGILLLLASVTYYFIPPRMGWTLEDFRSERKPFVSASRFSEQELQVLLDKFDSAKYHWDIASAWHYYYPWFPKEYRKEFALAVLRSNPEYWQLEKVEQIAETGDKKLLFAGLDPKEVYSDVLYAIRHTPWNWTSYRLFVRTLQAVPNLFGIETQQYLYDVLKDPNPKWLTHFLYFVFTDSANEKLEQSPKRSEDRQEGSFSNLSWPTGITKLDKKGLLKEYYLLSDLIREIRLATKEEIGRKAYFAERSNRWNSKIKKSYGSLLPIEKAILLEASIESYLTVDKGALQLQSSVLRLFLNDSDPRSREYLDQVLVGSYEAFFELALTAGSLKGSAKDSSDPDHFLLFKSLVDRLYENEILHAAAFKALPVDSMDYPDSKSENYYPKDYRITRISFPYLMSRVLASIVNSPKGDHAKAHYFLSKEQLGDQFPYEASYRTDLTEIDKEQIDVRITYEAKLEVARALLGQKSFILKSLNENSSWSLKEHADRLLEETIKKFRSEEKLQEYSKIGVRNILNQLEQEKRVN